MSRIILTHYDDGQERLVVGWDHPAGGAFWQEFNLEINPETKKPFWEENEDWQEVSRYGGMFPGLPLEKLKDDMPEDLREHVTDEVMELLKEHSKDPDSGYQKQAIDLSRKG